MNDTALPDKGPRADLEAALAKLLEERRWLQKVLAEIDAVLAGEDAAGRGGRAINRALDLIDTALKALATTEAAHGAAS